MRRSKPDLDLVLTHVDDRLDPRMRDAIGADSASVLPLLDRYSFTFLVEDPATVWHLGPERYDDLAARYNALTAHRDRLAIDINIVERYQDVYPTRQQTGTELLQLVGRASRVFPRVALYFENSILAADVPWLASAAAVVNRYESDGNQLVVESPNGVGIEWRGAALVDGRLWPAADGETLWVPAGRHKVGPAPRFPAVRLLDLTGELMGADSLAGGLEFSYRSDATCVCSGRQAAPPRGDRRHRGAAADAGYCLRVHAGLAPRAALGPNLHRMRNPDRRGQPTSWRLPALPALPVLQP